VPGAFCRDNGREFTANRLGGKAARLAAPRKGDLGNRRRWPAALPGDAEASGLWDVLGVRLITTLPYHPWSKPIESHFRAFRNFSYENLLPGWTGRDAKKKPEILAHTVRRGLLPTWEEFEEYFSRQVERWNTEHVCGERPGARSGSCARWSGRWPVENTIPTKMGVSRAGKSARGGRRFVGDTAVEA